MSKQTTQPSRSQTNQPTNQPTSQPADQPTNPPNLTCRIKPVKSQSVVVGRPPTWTRGARQLHRAKRQPCHPQVTHYVAGPLFPSVSLLHESTIKPVEATRFGCHGWTDAWEKRAKSAHQTVLNAPTCPVGTCLVCMFARLVPFSTFGTVCTFGAVGAQACTSTQTRSTLWCRPWGKTAKRQVQVYQACT